jgi:hypothetical protein
MPEVWLHKNRRALTMGLIVPVVGLICGTLLAAPILGQATWQHGLGLAVVAISILGLLLLFWRLRQPRIGRRGDELLFYLRSGRPIQVPLVMVEGFLLGQGPSYLRAHKPDASQVATVVIRLADRATDFAQRDVKPALGSWCNHYVTIRGTWCEPLSVSLVTKLNTRLADAQAAMQQDAQQKRGPR